MDAKIVMKSRETKGSASARRMRRDGWVPGVIYSEGTVARMVSLPKHEFEQMLRHHTSEHVMISIQVDGGAEEPVLVKDVQHNALSGGVVHVDMQHVDMNRKIRVEVPVELTGEPEGVKNQGGVLDHLLHHIEIECFPGDIPETVNVDVSALKIGDMITVKDIALDRSKYTLVADEDTGVALVAVPKVSEEPVAEEAVAAAEPEVIREKKKDEAAE